MTTTEQLTAGRELDALIARTIIIPGTHWDWPGWAEGYMSRPDTHYSTDIAAAWQVVEKLRGSGLEVDLLSEPGKVEGWAVKTNRPDEEFCQIVTAPTAPLAICHAALKAKEAQC